MEDIEESFIKGRVCPFHCIFITSVVKYGRIEQSVRITKGEKKCAPIFYGKSEGKRLLLTTTNAMQKSPF
jgi:hypothetical protein